MPLKDIFCQDKAIAVLQKARAAGRSAHAYIFAGPEGVGKFKTAGEWAKTLLCAEPLVEGDFADSCGSCESCRLFEAGSHPDFNHIYKELRKFTEDGKGKSAPVDLPIDVVREFLIAKVSHRPTASERKVFVLSEAEKLNNAAQSALLKVLEEPPAYCCIILLCTRLEKMLPTVKSRCQIIRFALIDENRIIEKLESMGLVQNRAWYFAHLAQGSLGSACQWARLELADAGLYETKKKLVDSLATLEYANALNVAGQLLEESKQIAAVWSRLDETTSRTDINRRSAKTVIRMVISILYDIMRLNIMPERSLINFDQKERIKELAKSCGPEQAAERITDCYKTLRFIDASVNEKLIFERLLLNLVVSVRIKVW